MTTDDTQLTVGKTTFFQGEHQTHPLLRIEPGIPHDKLFHPAYRAF